MFGFLAKAAVSLFGSSSNGKGIVTQVSDVADKWNPSETTQHKMSIEDLKAGDASQDSARGMEFVNHASWLDILIDAGNRSVRPLFSLWAFGILSGWWTGPNTAEIDPMVMNIIWTIVTFWFGARVLFKDLPNAIMGFRNLKK